MPFENKDKKTVPISFITLAHSLLPDVQAYFESEQGRQEFEAWKKAQQQENDGSN